jgi:serine/threonine protein kinase
LHSDAIVDDTQKIKFCKGIGKFDAGNQCKVFILSLYSSQSHFFTASGMSHLHTEGIIHRDLATRNILLSEGKIIL